MNTEKYIVIFSCTISNGLTMPSLYPTLIDGHMSACPKGRYMNFSFSLQMYTLTHSLQFAISSTASGVHTVFDPCVVDRSKYTISYQW